VISVEHAPRVQGRSPLINYPASHRCSAVLATRPIARDCSSEYRKISSFIVRCVVCVPRSCCCTALAVLTFVRRSAAQHPTRQACTTSLRRACPESRERSAWTGALAQRIPGCRKACLGPALESTQLAAVYLDTRAPSCAMTEPRVSEIGSKSEIESESEVESERPNERANG